MQYYCGRRRRKGEAELRFVTGHSRVVTFAISKVDSLTFLVALWLLSAAIASHLGAETRGASLSCKSGLSVHLYIPNVSSAKILRTPSGVELRVSDPVLTLSGAMVQDAVISTFRVDAAREDRERHKLRESYYSVALLLNPNGQDALQKVGIATGANNDLVVVCNGIVLIAAGIGQTRVEEIDVLIHESAEAAAEFARSFTSNVRFEQRTTNQE